MNKEREKVLEIRERMTKLVESLSKVFSTEEVISELMVARNYIFSPYAKELKDMLTEIGVFRVDYLSEIQMVMPEITQIQAQEMGLVDKKGTFLLRGRYCVPIRDISSMVTAIVGWDSNGDNSRKYVTTPTYGFSKDGQFFNIECYIASLEGNYTKIDGDESKGLVYLVEGIFDALALRALGFPALGNMGLDLSLIKTEILLRFGKVVVIPDNDKAGRGTTKYTNKISGRAKKAVWGVKQEHVVVHLPDGVKDVDDFIKGYYCVEDLLRCQKAKYKINLKDV